MEEVKIRTYLCVLACPMCKGELNFIRNDSVEGFFCQTCSLIYPIVKDIPEMLVESAIPYKNEPSSET